MPIPTLDGLRNMKADQLRSSIVAIDDALVALDQDEAGEMRSLSDSEQKRLDNLLMLRSRAEAHLAIRKQVDGHPDSVKPALAGDRENGSEGVRRDRRDIPPLLTRNQSVSDWVRRGRRDQPEMSFAKIARGLATGIWTDAELEQRAIAESPATAGGHMVSTPVAATVIDKARNASRVIAAGARSIPMTSATLKYPRLTTDAPASWRSEAGAITDQAMVFDSVTFTAQSLAVLVKISWELFEDTDPGSMSVVEDSFAKVLGTELDRAALRGSGSAPEPRGIRNQTGVTLTFR